MRKPSTVLFACLLSAGIGCGDVAQSDGDDGVDTLQIQDGLPVSGAGSAGQFEGIVEIKTTTARCTGTFITARHILTAGHCVPPGTNNDVKVRAPSWDGGAWHSDPNGTVIHYQADDRDHDVALIEFDGASGWATPQRRFRLFTGSVSIGANLNVYGYGVISTGFEDNGGPLRTAPNHATVNIVDRTDGHLKANVHTARICHGDSGGPAVDERGPFPVIWGIAHSFTEPNGADRGCPVGDHEMTWTKVNTNMNWIESRLGFACARPAGPDAFAQCW